MTAKNRIVRRLACLAVGVGMTAGSVAGIAAPAHGYSPNPKVSKTVVSTNKSHSYSDPFDGTYFKKDKGGTAAKVELRHKGYYVGKVEFHPYGEKLWIYDTYDDHDTFYVTLTYELPNGHMKTLGPYRPGSSHGVDKLVKDESFVEGLGITMTIWDGKKKDKIATVGVVA